MENKKIQYMFGVTRIFLGWMFLWAFLDKLFGLGFATVAEKSWLMGGSPTTGFLKFGTAGPFANIFQSLAGNPVVDWIFMIGLLCIGLALILDIGIRIAGYSGALLVFLMYLASSIPPVNNPLIDEHIIYALILILLTFNVSNTKLGLGNWWQRRKIVNHFPILR